MFCATSTSPTIDAAVHSKSWRSTGRSLSGLSDAIGEALRWRDASPLSEKLNHALFGGLRGAFVPEIDREH